jgi:hypothetical protein
MAANPRCTGYEPDAPVARRDLLARLATGLTGIALADLLHREGSSAVVDAVPTPKPHHAPRALRAIHIFLQGGLSQVDSFDYKPELLKKHGQPMSAAERPDPFFGKIGPLHRPHWEFKQRGASGLWISELFPEVAGCADELTVIRSMVSGTNNHTPATYMANTGFKVMGFPALGAWLSYGLGSETDDLPTFVALPDARGLPSSGANNWGNGFLPARHQGIAFRTQGPVIPDLAPARPVAERARDARDSLLAAMNRHHLAEHGESDALTARMRSYELAARMQLAVPEAVDLARESKETHALYGTDRAECADFARTCLLARRLLERGVRFVQLWAGGPFGGPTWDAHDDVPNNHGSEAKRIDRPVAGLLRDLRRRGLLDDTLVIFSSEFGRTPFAQSDPGQVGKGRDHNAGGFSTWLAGAGLKQGIAHGATDDFGYRAVDDPVSIHDFHATILHLLGIDHNRLTYRHAGRDYRLTDVAGAVVAKVLA